MTKDEELGKAFETMDRTKTDTAADSARGISPEMMKVENQFIDMVGSIARTSGPKAASDVVHELARRERDKPLDALYGMDSGDLEQMDKLARMERASGLPPQTIAKNHALAFTHAMGVGSKIAPFLPAPGMKLDPALAAKMKGYERHATTTRGNWITPNDLIERAGPHTDVRGLRMGKPKGDGRAGFVTDENDLQSVRCALEIAETFTEPQPLRLMRPAGSCFHHLQQAFHDLAVIVPHLNCRINLAHAECLDSPHAVFVVEHDWLKVFESAKDADGDVRLPAAYCAFELRANGKRIIACAAENIGGGQDVITVMMFVETREGWAFCNCIEIFPNGVVDLALAGGPAERIMRWAWGQVRALLISIEAEIVTRETRKPETGLVKSRVKSGRTPPQMYHVVSLARRHHHRDREAAEPTGRRLPLHFRRGHWRHYNVDQEDDAAACAHVWRKPDVGDHWRIRLDQRAKADKKEAPALDCCSTCRAYRLWINWTLVGDPDLGTIEKHYRV